jgi:hypothetical protein
VGGDRAHRQGQLTCQLVLFTAAICDGSNTSTPAVLEASSVSLNMIGFRLVDHDGCEFSAEHEDSRRI